MMCMIPCAPICPWDKWQQCVSEDASGFRLIVMIGRQVMSVVRRASDRTSSKSKFMEGEQARI